MDKMTIHRGLAELKIMDSRIEKAIKETNAVGFCIGDSKIVSNIYEKDAFIKEAQAKMQSVIDLLNRKAKIKSAITKANAETKVFVAGMEMTISDAINMKSLIGQKSYLSLSLKQQLRHVREAVEKNNATIDAQAVKLAETALGKDNVKVSDTDVSAIIDPYKKKNTAVVVDPLNIEALTSKIDEDVLSFTSEIDAVLSEVNAITYIEF